MYGQSVRSIADGTAVTCSRCASRIAFAFARLSLPCTWSSTSDLTASCPSQSAGGTAVQSEARPGLVSLAGRSR